MLFAWLLLGSKAATVLFLGAEAQEKPSLENVLEQMRATATGRASRSSRLQTADIKVFLVFVAKWTMHRSIDERPKIAKRGVPEFLLKFYVQVSSLVPA
jgi:hypothetical protein